MKLKGLFAIFQVDIILKVLKSKRDLFEQKWSVFDLEIKWILLIHFCSETTIKMFYFFIEILKYL